MRLVVALPRLCKLVTLTALSLELEEGTGVLDELGISTDTDESVALEEVLMTLELASELAVEETAALEEAVVAIILEAEVLIDDDLDAVDVGRVTALVELELERQLVDDETFREELDTIG